MVSSNSFKSLLEEPERIIFFSIDFIPLKINNLYSPPSNELKLFKSLISKNSSLSNILNTYSKLSFFSFAEIVFSVNFCTKLPNESYGYNLINNLES